MGYSTVVFDLDGTILNTLDDLHASMNYALQAHGLPLQTFDDTRRRVGNGIVQLVKKSLPQNSSQELFEQVHATFTEHYSQHANDATAPYPGIIELVLKLKNKGIACGVCTNKDDEVARELVNQFFPHCFSAVCGVREGIAKKPAPDTALNVMHALGGTLSSTVFVGDSEVDIATARNAQLPCIAVTWGFRSYSELVEAGAEVFVHSADELWNLIA